MPQVSPPRGPRAKPTVVDFHAHFMTPEVFEATYKLSVIGRLRAQQDGKAVRPFPQAQIDRMTDLKLRLAAMDEMGVDIQVISPNILHQCTYGLEPQDALRLERLNNDHAAELVAQQPDRLIGIGSVPMQNVEMAIHEMERAVLDLKLKGIIIASRIEADRSRRSEPAAVLEPGAGAGGADLRASGRQRGSAAAEAQPADLARPAARGGVRPDLADL